MADIKNRKPKRILNSILTALAIATIVVMAMGIRNYIKRVPPPLNVCQGNLKVIESAKARWALDNEKKDTEIPTQAELFGPTKFYREIPICPSGGSYTLGSLEENPRCSIPSHAL